MPLLYLGILTTGCPVIEGKQHIQHLKSYLENDWYKGHDCMGWHDSHQHHDSIYRGYWSFDSGAIVKLLGLDDHILKGVPYYLYDMVHDRDKDTGQEE